MSKSRMPKSEFSKYEIGLCCFSLSFSQTPVSNVPSLLARQSTPLIQMMKSALDTTCRSIERCIHTHTHTHIPYSEHQSVYLFDEADECNWIDQDTAFSRRKSSTWFKGKACQTIAHCILKHLLLSLHLSGICIHPNLWLKRKPVKIYTAWLQSC